MSKYIEVSSLSDSEKSQVCHINVDEIMMIKPWMQSRKVKDQVTTSVTIEGFICKKTIETVVQKPEYEQYLSGSILTFTNGWKFYCYETPEEILKRIRKTCHLQIDP